MTVGQIITYFVILPAVFVTVFLVIVAPVGDFLEWARVRDRFCNTGPLPVVTPPADTPETPAQG